MKLLPQFTYSLNTKDQIVTLEIKCIVVYVRHNTYFISSLYLDGMSKMISHTIMLRPNHHLEFHENKKKFI